MLFSVLFMFLFLKISEESPGIQNALVYLSKYGYLEGNIISNSSSLNTKAFKNSLKNFQSFAGIPVTGKFDENTIKVMSLPRCGKKDKINHGNIQGSKWGRYNLTYNIKNYPKNPRRKIVDKTIRKAFNLWSQHINLTFKKTKQNGDIIINFVKGEHGDDNPFDGPGGSVAHAFYPEFSGAVHFDLSENWTTKGDKGINLFQIAVHEIGHALGLDHSMKKKSAMNSFYKGYAPNFKLDQDDIQAIQKIYGRKTAKKPEKKFKKPTNKFPKFTTEMPHTKIPKTGINNRTFEIPSSKNEIYIRKTPKYRKINVNTPVISLSPKIKTLRELFEYPISYMATYFNPHRIY